MGTKVGPNQIINFTSNRGSDKIINFEFPLEKNIFIYPVSEEFDTLKTFQYQLMFSISHIYHFVFKC